MNPTERSYSYDRPHVHTWPGQTRTHYKGRGYKAHAARFKARHA